MTQNCAFSDVASPQNTRFHQTTTPIHFTALCGVLQISCQECFGALAPSGFGMILFLFSLPGARTSACVHLLYILTTLTHNTSILTEAPTGGSVASTSLREATPSIKNHPSGVVLSPSWPLCSKNFLRREISPPPPTLPLRSNFWTQCQQHASQNRIIKWGWNIHTPVLAHPSYFRCVFPRPVFNAS